MISSINGISSYNSYNDSLSNGYYQFCVVDRNNCIYCDTLIYLSVTDIAIKKTLYYPNPFNDIMYFKIPFYRHNSKIMFVLFDAAGRIVKKIQVSSVDFILSGASMTEGIYFFAFIEDGIIRDRGKVILN